MSFEWTDEAYAAQPLETRQVRRLLQHWFNAIEDGTVTRRMPDPLYPVAIGQDVADMVIAGIEEEFDRELRAWAYQESAGGYTAGPGFTRLAPPQRLALAQALHAILRSDGREKEPEELPAHATGWSPHDTVFGE